MKKVEQYIKDYTKICSNENVCSYYEPWLTPDHARCVAEIAREETIREVCEWIKNHLNDDYISVDEESVRMGFPYSYLETDLFIEDLKGHLERNS